MNTGDTILVSQHNPAMQDLEAAMGNSLDRNGLGGMRAPLPMGGQRATNMAPGTNPTDAATVAQASSFGVPIGGIIDWPAAAAPENWLLASGQAISRTTYATLFALIDTKFGAGDGSTTFQVPDYRGNVSAGLDNMGGVSAGRLAGATFMGALLGAQTVTLTAAQMPAHSHGGLTGSAGGHNHTLQFFLSSTAGFQAGSPTEPGTLGTPPGTSFAGEHTHGIASNGGGEAHANVQPTIAMNKIIRVL